jgi:hypothetical protein
MIHNPSADRSEVTVVMTPARGSAIGILGSASWRVQSRKLFLLKLASDSTPLVSDWGRRRVVEACLGRRGSDRPPLSDLALDEPVHGSKVTIVVSRRRVNAQE